MNAPVNHLHKTMVGCWIVVCFLGAARVCTPVWGQAALDVRNFIPGDVDAPVFDVDGTTRLDNELILPKGTYYACAVYAGTDPEHLFPVAAPLLVGSGDRAGYWNTVDTNGVLYLAWVTPGQTAYVQFRVYEFRRGDVYDPERGPTIYEWVESEVLEVDTLSSGEAVPIRSMKSLKLESRRLTISSLDKHTVLRWLRPVGGGYVLEVGVPVLTSLHWETVIAEESVPPYYVNLEFVSFTNHTEAAVTFYRLRRLWTPPTSSNPRSRSAEPGGPANAASPHR